MRVARLDHPVDFEGWRRLARDFAAARVPPEAVIWEVAGEGGGLFAEEGAKPGGAPRALSVPAGFIALAQEVVCHRAPARFGLLYRLLVRLQDERDLLKVATDPDVHQAEAMAKAVRRDMHKMTAFVRFRSVRDEAGEEAFVAWFEPEHHILDRVSGFFVKRFAAMHWSILTPQGSLHWDGETLHRGAAASRTDAPDEDRMETYWRTYYASIFNPARVKVKAMKAEMPVKYWRNLPEAALISGLIAGAGQRASGMVAQAPTEPPERHRRAQARREPEVTLDVTKVPPTLADARAAARDCRRCGLCEQATQTVFGEGPGDAPVMFVGEQPGDREDLAGRPFIGPAGQLFDRAMAQAGLARERAYVTNAVKHFKFSLRGKRRIHQKPDAAELMACRHWLDVERALVRPRLVVALGATAVRALTGHAGPLAAVRERALTLPDGTALLATVHPSYLLRLPDERAQAEETRRFVADLARAGDIVPELRAHEAA